MSLYTVQNLVLISAIIAWIIFVVFLLVKHKDKYGMGSSGGMDIGYSGSSGGMYPPDNGSEDTGYSGSSDGTPTSYTVTQIIADMRNDAMFSIRVSVPETISPDNNYIGISDDCNSIILTSISNCAMCRVDADYVLIFVTRKGGKMLCFTKLGERTTLYPYGEYNKKFYKPYALEHFDTSSKNNNVIDVTNAWRISGPIVPIENKGTSAIFENKGTSAIFYYSGGPAQFQPLSGMANVVYCEQVLPYYDVPIPIPNTDIISSLSKEANNFIQKVRQMPNAMFYITQDGYKELSSTKNFNLLKTIRAIDNIQLAIGTAVDVSFNIMGPPASIPSEYHGVLVLIMQQNKKPLVFPFGKPLGFIANDMEVLYKRIPNNLVPREVDFLLHIDRMF